MDSVTRKAFEYAELLYDSVVDSSAWSTFLEKLSFEFSEASIAILHLDTKSEKTYTSQHVRYETGAMISFNEHYADINPWAQPELIRPNGLLVPTDELLTESDLIKTEFYHDWLRPQNLLKGFGISLGGSQPVNLLSIVRSSAAGAPRAVQFSEIPMILRIRLRSRAARHRVFRTLSPPLARMML